MGDASTQLTDRLHFLRKCEMFLDGLKLFIGLEFLRDVARDLGKSDEISHFIADCVDDDGCPKRGATLSDAPAFRLVFSRFGSGLKRAVRNARLFVLFGIKCAQVFADYFRLGVTFDPLCAWISRSDKSVGVELEDCVVDNCFYKPAVPALAVEQRLSCELPLGDIAGNFRKTKKLAVFVTNGVNDNARPELRSIFPNPPTVGVETTRLASGAEGSLRRSGLLVLRSIKPAKRLADDFARGVALQPNPTRIPTDDATFQVQHVNRVIYDRIDKKLDAIGLPHF